MVTEHRLGVCDAAVVHAVHGLQAYARHADIVWVVGHGGREEGVQGDGISRTQWEPLGWSLGAVAVRCSQGHDGGSRGVVRLWTLAVGYGLGIDQFQTAIGINGVSILPTQLSTGERHETRRVGPYAMPLDQHRKGGHDAREPG
jgi:hypothetical protein